MFGYEFTPDHEVVGRMPDGKTEIFGSVDEYEDCYYDALYRFNDGYSIEWPEVY